MNFYIKQNSTVLYFLFILFYLFIPVQAATVKQVDVGVFSFTYPQEWLPQKNDLDGIDFYVKGKNKNVDPILSIYREDSDIKNVAGLMRDEKTGQWIIAGSMSGNTLVQSFSVNDIEIIEGVVSCPTSDSAGFHAIGAQCYKAFFIWNNNILSLMSRGESIYKNNAAALKRYWGKFHEFSRSVKISEPSNKPISEKVYAP